MLLCGILPLIWTWELCSEPRVLCSASQQQDTHNPTKAHHLMQRQQCLCGRLAFVIRLPSMNTMCGRQQAKIPYRVLLQLR